MRLYVYSICKNELHNISAFLEQCKEADGLVIVDTGSTDGTREYLTSKNIKWYDYPYKDSFRFDEARNYAHCLIPEDVEIRLAMDVDSTITKGYADIIKEYWLPELTNAEISTRVNNIESTTIDCHNKYCFWKYPVYEKLTCKRDMYVRKIPNIEITKQVTRSREKLKFYLDLAEKGLRESPEDEMMKRIYKSIKEDFDRWQMN